VINNQEIIKVALASIETATGELTDDAVVQAARDPGHVLHGYFDWDDTTAAAKWRLQQARRLITSVTVRVSFDEQTVVVPVYVRSPDALPHQQGYARVQVIAQDEAKVRATMRYEVSRAFASMKRARDLGTAMGVAQQLRVIVEQLAVVLDNLERDAA
jgi:hypothetical protein